MSKENKTTTKKIPNSFPQGNTPSCMIHSYINAKKNLNKLPFSYKLKKLIENQDHTDENKIDDNAQARYEESLISGSNLLNKYGANIQNSKMKMNRKLNYFKKIKQLKDIQQTKDEVNKFAEELLSPLYANISREDQNRMAERIGLSPYQIRRLPVSASDLSYKEKRDVVNNYSNYKDQLMKERKKNAKENKISSGDSDDQKREKLGNLKSSYAVAASVGSIPKEILRRDGQRTISPNRLREAIKGSKNKLVMGLEPMDSDIETTGHAISINNIPIGQHNKSNYNIKYTDSNADLKKHNKYNYFYPSKEFTQVYHPSKTDGAVSDFTTDISGDKWQQGDISSLHDVPKSFFEHAKSKPISKLQQIRMLRRSNSIDENLPEKMSPKTNELSLKKACGGEVGTNKKMDELDLHIQKQKRESQSRLKKLGFI